MSTLSGQWLDEPEQQRAALQRVRGLSGAERQRVGELLERGQAWVHHELFDLPDDEMWQAVFERAEPVELPESGWYVRLLGGQAADHSGGEHETFVLSAAQERTLFVQYNYWRFRVGRLVEAWRAGDEPLSARGCRRLLGDDERAQSLRNRIVEANLPLVLAMGKRVKLAEADYPDALGEAHLDLMRAVELFDVSRGYKFSTYACRAILNALRRVQRKGQQQQGLFPVTFEPALERDDAQERRRREREQGLLAEVHEAVRRNRAGLTEVERQVLSYRFAIPRAGQEPARAMTLAEVGKLKGFSKERARQIQKQALDKIRELYAPAG